MNKKTNTFLLSSEESELLLQLEEALSLQQIADQMGRDHSVVSRSLKKMSDKLPVVDKKGGRWVLTEMGKKFNEASRMMIAMQTSFSQTQQTLRLGTNREFAARVLGPDLGSLIKIFPNTHLLVNSYERGVEEALLKGQIDIGFDCDRPNDPEIAYKLILDEPIIAICSKSFFKTHQKKIAQEDYLDLPHLLCERLHPDKILLKVENNLKIIARFNDIATARAACLQGIGWALLPRYAISDELKNKTLIQMDTKIYGKSKYGLWWIRHRIYLKESVDKMLQWMDSKEL